VQRAATKSRRAIPSQQEKGMVEYKQVPQWLYKKGPQWLPTGMGFNRTVAWTVAVVIHFDWRQQGLDGGALEQKMVVGRRKTKSTRRLGEDGLRKGRNGFWRSVGTRGRETGLGSGTPGSGGVNRLRENGNWRSDLRVGKQDRRLRGCGSGTRVMSGDVTRLRSGGTRGNAEVLGVRLLAPSDGPGRAVRRGGPGRRSDEAVRRRGPKRNKKHSDRKKGTRT
jgi:hypothetical protein